MSSVVSGRAAGNLKGERSYVLRTYTGSESYQSLGDFVPPSETYVTQSLVHGAQRR